MIKRIWVVTFFLICFVGCNSRERFPISLGDVKLSTLTVSWDNDVFLNHKYRKYIEVYNPGKEKVKLRCIGSIPEINECSEFNFFLKSDTTLNWSKDGLTINPKSIDTLAIDFFPVDTNGLGYFQKEFIIEVNNTVQYQHILMKGQVKEYFGQLEKLRVPLIQIDTCIFDFGCIYEGEKAKHEFIISNSGKSNLIIRKVETICGCTTAILDKRVIEPGTYVKLSLVFRSPGKQGKQNKIITIYSNDPACPTKNITIKGEVLKR